jgi:ankyrin repeat protein
MTSQTQVQKLLTTLKLKEDFNLAHRLCKSGSLETLRFFQSKLPAKDTSGVLDLSFIDEAGQNCLHYAVGRNRQDFVRYLLREHTPKVDVNQRTTDTGESPLFFALGKLKQNHSEKVKMVKLLLEEAEGLDVGMLNNEKKACYEAYNDMFGYDEAA